MVGDLVATTQLVEQQGGTFTTITQTNPKKHHKLVTTRSGRVIESEVDENAKKERSMVEAKEEQEEKRKEKESEEDKNQIKGELVENEQEKKEINE